MPAVCQCGCGLPTRIARRTNHRIGEVEGQPKPYIAGHRSGRFRPGKREHESHGMAGTVEYATFIGAKQRCTNQNAKAWPFYGGRGIKFLFTSFQEFLDTLGPRPSDEHSIDRIDPNGNYEPGNVRWATRDVQATNKRGCWHVECVEVPPEPDDMSGEIRYRTTATMCF